MGSIVVYVSGTSMENLRHSESTGVWGFKARVQSSLDIYDGLKPGDHVVFASDFRKDDGRGAARASVEEWSNGSLGSIFIGEITSTVYEDTQPHWPNENLDEESSYPVRFKFRPLWKTNRLVLKESPEGFVEGLQRSAPGNGSPKPIVESPFFQELFSGVSPDGFKLSISQWGGEQVDSFKLHEALISASNIQRGFPLASQIKANDPSAAARSAAVKAFAESLKSELGQVSENPLQGGWQVDHGGAQGMASPVAWIRIYDAMSPSATNGWYLVFLIQESGEGVYLSVAQGVTGASPKSIREEIQRAQLTLGIKTSGIIEGGIGNSSKAKAYEEASAVATYIASSPKELKTDREFIRLIDQYLKKLNSVRKGVEMPQAEERSQSSKSEELYEKLKTYRNVILEGVAGTGKSHLIRDLNSKFDGMKVMVFHPSTSYEDFVEGLRPVGDRFEVIDGTFLSFIKTASESPDQDFLLVIDEINRASTAKVLGDLLYSIEPSKRVDTYLSNSILSSRSEEPAGISEPWIELQNLRFDPETNSSFRQRFVVPENLYILGTMNTTDRSVGQVDLALRRRFIFDRINPLTKSELRDLMGRDDLLDKNLEEWAALNTALAQISPDAMLGHSYFFEDAAAKQRQPNTVRNIWRDQLLPQLAEIVVAFNAIGHVDALCNSGASFGGYTLRTLGKGIDAYPIVVER
jgi:hypothetical protein